MLYICETNFDYSIKDVVWIFNTTYQNMVVADVKHVDNLFYVWVNMPIDYNLFKENKIIVILLCKFDKKLNVCKILQLSHN